MSTCQCGQPAVVTCANCKCPVCEDISCGMDTVDGYLCGEYTQWGCAKKYTTCDECCEEKAIHEGDFVQCVECYTSACPTCAEGDFTECENCEEAVCKICLHEHECDEFAGLKEAQ